MACSAPPSAERRDGHDAPARPCGSSAPVAARRYCPAAVCHRHRAADGLRLHTGRRRNPGPAADGPSAGTIGCGPDGEMRTGGRNRAVDADRALHPAHATAPRDPATSPHRSHPCPATGLPAHADGIPAVSAGRPGHAAPLRGGQCRVLPPVRPIARGGAGTHARASRTGLRAHDSMRARHRPPRGGNRPGRARGADHHGSGRPRTPRPVLGGAVAPARRPAGRHGGLPDRPQQPQRDPRGAGTRKAAGTTPARQHRIPPGAGVPGRDATGNDTWPDTLHGRQRPRDAGCANRCGTVPPAVARPAGPSRRPTAHARRRAAIRHATHAARPAVPPCGW